MTGRHAAPLNDGVVGVLHGNRTYLMQDEDGLIKNAFGSAGLDYPGVGPEHAWLKEVLRAEYVAVTDEAALDAFRELNRLRAYCRRRISHALAYAAERAHDEQSQHILINLSGQYDKIPTVARLGRISIG